MCILHLEKTFLGDLTIVFRYLLTLLRDWDWIIICDRILCIILILLLPLQAKPEGIMVFCYMGQWKKKKPVQV